MTFTDEQNKALSAPLSPKVVAKRRQGGGEVSYIEGWHAIAEANRIFGFDGWTRETLDLRPVGQTYENKNGNKVVNYSCRVRICVGDLIREGCGFGQGIDRDEGQAHESALKEAETDAMKRAFMTFGNPFGLALYDKTQSNVREAPPPTITDEQRNELMALCDSSGFPVKRFLDTAKITDLRQLPADKFAGGKAWIIEQIALQKEAA
ncbi:RAD52 family DNA repair protein [Aurantiacibacter spongiae]|uniref:DNA repair protein Rad52 n=1 Tax=Aurantiacibacter spongiae TaxID=2488860 RepID=A0A3N5DIK7_9SPHN|nr:RAD52 family DNA repair protein [Aurantiacibacter spongiae]RPF70465.1 hypothetical protein EG799_01585 [Aurantiacibacter spongiae]